MVKIYQADLALDPYDLERQSYLVKVYLDAGRFDQAAKQIVDMVNITKTIRDDHQLEDRGDYGGPLTAILAKLETSTELIDALSLIGDSEEAADERYKKCVDEAIVFLNKLKQSAK